MCIRDRFIASSTRPLSVSRNRAGLRVRLRRRNACFESNRFPVTTILRNRKYITAAIRDLPAFHAALIDRRDIAFDTQKLAMLYSAKTKLVSLLHPLTAVRSCCVRT